MLYTTRRPLPIPLFSIYICCSESIMQLSWIAHLAGFALALPATVSGGCIAQSRKLKSWTVRHFDFHADYIFSTPSHQNSWGYVNFTLENSVLDYKPICSAQSDQLQDFFYGNVIYSCQGVPHGDKATFTFNRANNHLHINQTWHCPGASSTYPDSVFDARGGANLLLSCTDCKWQNPDWQMGEFYSTESITCDHVTVPVPIREIDEAL